MRFDVSDYETRKAGVPHEIFLTNLIGNHILMAIAAGGVAGSFPWVMAIIPVISFGLLGYSLWRARRSRQRDPWFVMCHWQVSARRSRLFILVLLGLVGIAVAAWAAHVYGGVMKEAAIALAIGIGLLPVMVTVLVLILVESDALHQAHQGKLPGWVFERFPNPEAKVISDHPEVAA
ncbi:MAG: hypothetical protein EA400_04690 [Chromatiaceae bacterium]|nr:MAG: hypothetical protein EA400_04690 [Chromatiaceae bacterium]